MTLRSGLIPNLNPPGISGLVSGLNPGAIVELLADFNYQAAVVIGVGGNGTFAHANATSEWLLQEPSGTYASNVGGAALTVNGSLNLQGQTAVGLYDGASHTARKAWEVLPTAASGEFCIAGTTTEFDSNNEDIAACVVFRIVGAAVLSYFVNKRDSGANEGWSFNLTAAGQVQCTVDDGTTAKTITLTGPYDDAAWHFVKLFYSHSAKTLTVRGDLDSESGPIATGITDSLTNSIAFRLGNGPVFGGSPDGTQITYAGGCVGANARAYYDEVVVVPGADTAPTQQTTTSRASLISHEVAPGFVGHFSGGTTPADCQLPITYSAALEAAAGGLGLFCNSAVVNLVPNNRLVTGATGATTNTDNFADAADGFRAAAKSVATASPDFIGKTCVTVAATVYTGSVFLKEETVGVVGRAYAYDLTNSAEIAGSATAFTADGTWEQRIKTPAFTTPALCVSVSLRVEITNSGEGVLHDFWQLELGDGAGAIINTAGGSSALVKSDYRGAGDYIQETAGELRTTFVHAKNGQLGAILGNAEGVDEREIFITGSDKLLMQVENSAGGLEYSKIHAASHAADTEVVARLLWDESAAGVEGFRGVSFDGATRDNGAASPWSAASGGGFSAAVHIGMDRAATTQLDGWIAQIECFDGAEI